MSASDCTGPNTRFAGSVSVCPTPAAPAASCCPADFDQNGTVTVQDIYAYIGAFFSGDPLADTDGNGTVSVQDIFQYLAAFFAGC